MGDLVFEWRAFLIPATAVTNEEKTGRERKREKEWTD